MCAAAYIALALGIALGLGFASLFRCALFGHTPHRGYYGTEGGGYFDVRRGGIDGVNREHVDLTCKCEHCGTQYTVGRFHARPTDDLFSPTRFSLPIPPKKDD